MEMKTLKQAWNYHKSKQKDLEVRAIRADFWVAEKNGRIYLIHHGYAFAEMDKYASASDIAGKLNEARKTALEFEGL